MDNALTKEKMSVVESKKSKRLDSLLDVLMAKVMESDVWVNGSLKLVESLLRNCKICMILKL